MRLRTNFAKGVVETALATGSTVLTSADLAGLPVVAAGSYMALTLDPLGDDGAPEVIHVTAHVAAATTATILRAREGTTARAHAIDVPWVHGATTEDFGAVVRGHLSQPSEAKVYVGMDLDRIEAAASHPADDEFNDNTLDPSWIAHTFRPNNVRWIESGDVLSMRYNPTDVVGANEVSFLLKPISGFGIGQAIETCVSYCSSNVIVPRFGLMLSNGVTHGTGVQVMATVDIATSSPFRNIGTRTHVGFNATPVVTTVALAPPTPSRLFLRLVWQGTNSFRVEVSPDGINWLESLVASRTVTLTPTHMGLWFMGAGATTQFALSFEYFRVTAFRESWEY